MKDLRKETIVEQGTGEGDNIIKVLMEMEKKGSEATPELMWSI